MLGGDTTKQSRLSLGKGKRHSPDHAAFWTSLAEPGGAAGAADTAASRTAKALEHQRSFSYVQLTGAGGSDPHGTLTPQQGQRLLPDSTRAAAAATCPGEDGIRAMPQCRCQRVIRCGR